MDTPELPPTNRSRKVAGRAKRRRYVQGTRTYTHAMTNSKARRYARRQRAARTDRSGEKP
jgi:hypothetical protein